MSQPNLSKRLNLKDKACFTIEQLFNVAEIFDVSIDSLFGHNQKNHFVTSERSIALNLQELIDIGIAKLSTIKVKKSQYSLRRTPSGTKFEENSVEEVPYTAVYFPESWMPLGDVGSEISNVTENDSNASIIGKKRFHVKINDYLKGLHHIRSIRHEIHMDDVVYNAALDGLINQLSDIPFRSKKAED